MCIVIFDNQDERIEKYLKKNDSDFVKNDSDFVKNAHVEISNVVARGHTTKNKNIQNII